MFYQVYFPVLYETHPSVVSTGLTQFVMFYTCLFLLWYVLYEFYVYIFGRFLFFW